MTCAAVEVWYGASGMPLDVATRAPVLSPPAVDAAAQARRFGKVFDEHHDHIWRTLRRLGVAEAQVDDALQQVFLVVARRLDTIRVGEEGAFLYGVALRQASSMRRRDPARREVSGEVVLELLADDAAGPEENLLKSEALDVLDEVLAGVPDDLREVLVLVELEGVSVAVLAEVLDVPFGTASSRLRRAREAFTSSARRVRSRHGGGLR